MDLHAPAAQGKNAFVAGTNIPNIMAMSGRYGIAAERLTAAIIHAPARFRKDMANKLLTAVSLLAEMYPDLREEGDWSQEREESEPEREARRERHRQKLHVIETVWQQVAKRVAYRSGSPALDDEDEDNSQSSDGDRDQGDDRRVGEHHWLGGREQIANLAHMGGVEPEALLQYTDTLFDALYRRDRDADRASAESHSGSTARGAWSEARETRRRVLRTRSPALTRFPACVPALRPRAAPSTVEFPGNTGGRCVRVEAVARTARASARITRGTPLGRAIHRWRRG